VDNVGWVYTGCGDFIIMSEEDDLRKVIRLKTQVIAGRGQILSDCQQVVKSQAALLRSIKVTLQEILDSGVVEIGDILAILRRLE